MYRFHIWTVWIESYRRPVNWYSSDLVHRSVKLCGYQLRSRHESNRSDLLNQIHLTQQHPLLAQASICAYLRVGVEPCLRELSLKPCQDISILGG